MKRKTAKEEKVLEHTRYFDATGCTIGEEFVFPTGRCSYGQCPPLLPGEKCEQAISRTEYFGADAEIMIGEKIVFKSGTIKRGICP